MSDQPPLHTPVLLGPILEHCGPIRGAWLDGTLGAGGYARALLDAGAESLIGVDRDPLAIQLAQNWLGEHAGKVTLVEGEFADLDQYSNTLLDGVVLDLGISSMQIDQAARGFSFQKDGPLDMRMSQSGTSAADIVNTAPEEELADILYHYGEERASRRIARAIVASRLKEPITRTLVLAELVSGCLKRPKPGQSHPATRSFQALRIATNRELDQLQQGLIAAERILAPGGILAVVTFHSLEDRIVKRFLQSAAGREANTSRYVPARPHVTPRFELITRRAIAPDGTECATNPRARSAKLRIARRTDAPSAQDTALNTQNRHISSPQSE